MSILYRKVTNSDFVKLKLGNFLLFGDDLLFTVASDLKISSYFRCNVAFCDNLPGWSEHGLCVSLPCHGSTE